MGKKHDEFIMNLDYDDLVMQIEERFFDKPSCWSSYHELATYDYKDWKIDMVKSFLDGIKGVPKYNDGSMSKIKNSCEVDQELINGLLEGKAIDRFNFKKTIEFPLVKGSGQYKTTKGFIDLIIYLESKVKGKFSLQKKIEPVEILFEIKTSNDLKDMGKIIRQIKEYKSYYSSGCEKWHRVEGYSMSRWINDKCSNKEFGYAICLLIDKISEEKKKFLEDNDIPVFIAKFKLVEK